jgi:MFS family permease
MENEKGASASRSSGSSSVPRFPWIGKRPFYGWIIVFVGMVTQFFQGVSSQGFSTYLTFLQKDFGWSKAVMAAPRSVTSIEGAIFGPLEGFLVDKFGPRLMVTIGVFVMGLGFILFGLTNSLLMYYAANIVIDVGTGLQGMIIMSVAVNKWFRRKRTIAQSVMLLGFSMAGVVGVPLLVLTQNVFGWQISAIGSGLIIWAVGFPCTLLLRSEPEPYGLMTDGDTPDNASAAGSKNINNKKDEHDFTLREAARTRAFWFLAFGWALGGLGMGAAQVHLFLHLEQGVGLTAATSALVWTVASVTNIPFRLVGGFFGDRIPKNLMLGVSTFLIAISMFFLGIANSVQIALVYAVLYGIGWGIRTPVMNAIQGEYFGRKSMGIIFGMLQSISLPFSIASPIVAGYLADVQGNYRMTFIVMSFITLAGSIVISLATRPKPRQYQEYGLEK